MYMQRSAQDLPALFNRCHQRPRCWLALHDCSSDQPSSTASHLLSAALNSSRLQDGGQRPRHRLPNSSHVLELSQQLVVVTRDALVLCPHHAQLAYLEQGVQIESTNGKHFTAQDRVGCNFGTSQGFPLGAASQYKVSLGVSPTRRRGQVGSDDEGSTPSS